MVSEKKNSSTRHITAGGSFSLTHMLNNMLFSIFVVLQKIIAISL